MGDQSAVVGDRSLGCHCNYSLLRVVAACIGNGSLILFHHKLVYNNRRFVGTVHLLS